jgi:hypothetical protein
MSLNNLHSIFFKQSKDNKPGLWANIHAKRKRGEAPAKPGSEDYPDAKNWKRVTEESEKKASPAWQRSEGKNPEGGLNEKGRASLRAEGRDIKRPQPEGGARKDSFCARMKGMKAKLTSKETANDPDSRINKSLRKWKCGSAPDLVISEKLGSHDSLSVKKAFLGDLANRASAFYGNLSPAARSALIGAGVGGVGNVLLGNRRKSLLNRLVTGGAVGAAAGGLGRMGYDYYNNYSKQPFNAPNAGMLQNPYSTNMHAPVQLDSDYNPLPLHSMPPGYNPDAPRQ